MPTPATAPVLFINLDRDIERRQRMEMQLQQLHATRLCAIWWNDVTLAEQQNFYNPSLNAYQYYKPLVNGEKGCYLSHIRAWQRLLASDAPFMVVLEDDVVIQGSFSTALEAIQDLNMSWDMIKLMGRAQEKIQQKFPLSNGLSLIQYRRVPSYTAGYAISRAGAQKLLASRIPFGRPIDIDLRFWWENDMRIYGIYPPVIALDDTSQTSSINGRQQGTSLQTRWKKLKMKLQLAVGNARHLPQQQMDNFRKK